MKSISFKTDINGNKCLSVKFQGFRAFSIQTLGNLPIAHKATFESVDVELFKQIESEVHTYLILYGTQSQKRKAGLFTL